MIPIAKPYLTTEDAQAAYDTIMTGWITQGPRAGAVNRSDEAVPESWSWAFSFDGFKTFNRSITPTNLPSSKDHVVSTALGFKYKSKSGVTALFNALVPLRSGSLQPAVTFTAGLEINR